MFVVIGTLLDAGEGPIIHQLTLGVATIALLLHLLAQVSQLRVQALYGEGVSAGLFSEVVDNFLVALVHDATLVELAL